MWLSMSCHSTNRQSLTRRVKACLDQRGACVCRVSAKRMLCLCGSCQNMLLECSGATPLPITMGFPPNSPSSPRPSAPSHPPILLPPPYLAPACLLTMPAAAPWLTHNRSYCDPGRDMPCRGPLLQNEPVYMPSFGAAQLTISRVSGSLSDSLACKTKELSASSVVRK